MCVVCEREDRGNMRERERERESSERERERQHNREQCKRGQIERGCIIECSERGQKERHHKKEQ